MYCGPVPLLSLEPLIDLPSPEAPVLADLSGGNPPVLRQRVKGRFGDLEIALELVNREDIGLQWLHWSRNNNCYQLLRVIIYLSQPKTRLILSRQTKPLNGKVLILAGVDRLGTFH